MVQIEESIIIAVAGMVFIPVFVFAIKMIMEVGNMKTRTDSIEAYIKEAKEMYHRVISLEGEAKAMKQDIIYRHVRDDETHERMQKQIDMLEQFSYGRESKSVPSFLSDRIETQQHKDSKEMGLFDDRDSEETQAEKDVKNRGRKK